MKFSLIFAVFALLFSPGTIGLLYGQSQDLEPLGIGSKAPDFKLPATDGATYTLASFSKSKLLLIVFTCNHCPTAQAYEDRLIQLTSDYSKKSVSVVAISPNDPEAVRLDELGYSDMGDSFDEMKLRAREKHYNFPYLYDGKTQQVARAYGPVATPHVFIFDAERKLRFQGRIDDVESPAGTPTVTDTRNAIEALLAGKPVPVPTTKVFGCSVKWAEKKDHQAEAAAEWAKEPVSLEMADESVIRELLANKSGKLRLINVWATWCGPCVTEFPDLVNINRMYRGRDFEFINISADVPAQKNKVLGFLKGKQASGKNYLFSLNDKYKLIEAIDPKWQGALPYTLLVEPGGKIIYARQGRVNVAALKKQIVENPLIGRFYTSLQNKNSIAMNGSIEERIGSMGLQLPILPTSKGIYKSCLLVGNLLYVSGHVSVNADGSYITGKLGKDLGEEAGKEAARQCGLAILSTIKKHYNLDKIRRVIKLLGMVNATPDFEKHPVVINGCSELFAALWGEENGIGVRSAVGMGSLPGNVAVEIEAIFEVKD